MVTCPSCSAEQTDSSKFCSECGAALSPEFSATVIRGAGSVTNDSSVHSALSDSSLHGMFLPGTKVADRYRIVSLVGKGGMGEVYRADDLKLGHTVALKFLPNDLAEDPQRLEYFHSKVRLTRQISHPNVCRVYDIGEMDGQHFLSMEYIDGEDLKVLLRRIGRLPKDKGVEIAQQLCAGIATAHDKGVLHRDLKPANIMIDGRGQVRITDFGLAKLAEDQTDGEVAGTPAYMAPEQLTRGETTIQSDLYSLGLILHELFTGEAVHQPGSVQELLRSHEEWSPSQPSTLVDDMDPDVERVILRCLEKQPHDRPKSAHTVAAALPGGDPLAAALAAGETPSPEMVAAAGETIGLHPGVAIATLIGVAVCLLIVCWLAEKTHVVNQAVLREPAVLVDKAQELIRENLGYTDPSVDPSVDATHDFVTEEGSLLFWYRQRSAGRFAVSSFWSGRHSFSRGRPTILAPPWVFPNELGVRLSPRGELRYFRARAPQTAAPNTAAVDSSKLPWQEWFPKETTGLDLARDGGEAVAEEPHVGATVLTVVPDRSRTPPDAFDAVRVWKGVDEESGEEFFVEAAAYRGKPVYFEIFSAKRFEAEPPPPSENMGEDIWYALRVLVIIGGSVLAWRNMRSGRGNRRGAMRFASFVFWMGTIIWFTQARHSFVIGDELRSFIMGSAQALFDAVLLWIVYVAFEPVLRRLWPQILISWTRLLDGRLRDPIVGRDLLLGAAGGVAMSLVMQLNLLAHLSFLDQAPNMKGEVKPISLAGSKELVASALEVHLNGINVAVMITMVLVLFRILLRSERRALVAWHLVLIVFLVLSSGSSYAIGLLPWGLIVATQYVLLVRFGILAAVVQMIVHTLAIDFPLTLDTNHWYFNHGLFAVAWISAIALYGFYTSLGNRSVFGTADAKPV